MALTVQMYCIFPIYILIYPINIHLLTINLQENILSFFLQHFPQRKQLPLVGSINIYD